MVDSKTGYLGCVPMNSKNQFDLATKEIIAFCQTLGYNDVMLRCDNEPSVLQLQRLVVQARKQMGLRTQACTPSAYEHGNALAENGIQNQRSCWKHHAWFTDETGSNSEHESCFVDLVYEAFSLGAQQVQPPSRTHSLRYGKPYTGQICEYGEPVLGFAKSPMKGNPRWHMMLFLGKVEGEDGFVQWDFTDPHALSTKGSNKLDFTYGFLQRVQLVLMAIQSLVLVEEWFLRNVG
jgi:hypothetical protein